MNSTRRALLNAVLANRDDDAPRLIFADWLQENGEEERAEFIRESVRDVPWGGQYTSSLEMAREYRKNAGVPDWLTANGIQIKRGFISWIRLPASDWLTHADAILAEHPVEEVELTTMPTWAVSTKLFGTGTAREIYLADMGRRWPGIKFTMPIQFTRPDNVASYLGQQLVERMASRIESQFITVTDTQDVRMSIEFPPGVIHEPV